MTSVGLLSTKSDALLISNLYNFSFYMHIILGGISLLIGWTQFREKLRYQYLQLHRTLGAIYLLCVLLSGTSGLYIAYYATGGLVSTLGFSSLAILWLFTSYKAYAYIRQGKVKAHKYWMIRSYALTFAAVTLRLWLPFLINICSLDFISAYKIVAWLCWVPNVFIAELIICKLSKQS